MAETKHMTTAEIDAKARADKAAAEKAAADKAAAETGAKPVDKAVELAAKPAAKVAKPGELETTAAAPSPTQAEADAIREGTFGRNRDAAAEAPATGYKTR